MNREHSQTTRGSLDFLSLLGLAFIVLKLTGVIDWSWLWVLAPLWIPLVIGVTAVVIVYIAVAMRGR